MTSREPGSTDSGRHPDEGQTHGYRPTRELPMVGDDADNLVYRPDAEPTYPVYDGAWGPAANQPTTPYAGYPVTGWAAPHAGQSAQAYPHYPYGYGTAPTDAYPYPAYPAREAYNGRYAYPYGAQPQYPAAYAPPAAPSRTRRLLIGVGSAALAVGLVLSGMAISRSEHSAPSAQNVTPVTPGGSGNAGVLPGGPAGAGTAQQPGTSASASVATATQQVGIVTIVSVLAAQNAESAGTGMIMSSNGEVLTNNHVINGASSITVTVESTGRSYQADVVGTAPTKDVAVIKLRDASGLKTAKLGTTADVRDLGIGDSIVGVGNAGGTGTLRAAAGKVTALNQSITATDESGSSSEKLQGLIQINAGIISGDSGGPLYDGDGDIVGMDTAASADSTQAVAYAIPLDKALSVAKQILAGKRSDIIHIGLPAFIGIAVSPTVTGGAGVQSVIADGPADKAGITGGSLITAAGGQSVGSYTALKTILSNYRPGQSVSLTWTDPSGQSHTADVTTVAGPAD